MQKRVLQVVAIMDRGGEETMIMNYYRCMNREEIQFDFLVHWETKGVYEEEIEKLGGKIYRAFPIRPWNYSKYRAWLKKFFEEHKGEYCAVHAHILENCGFVLDAAKEAGVPVRIAHSHSSQQRLGIKTPFRIYGKHVLKKSGVNLRLACGEEAGKYLYEKEPFTVFPNAVDTSLFRYDLDTRREVRKEFGVEDEIVLGNVGRFHPLKNQDFLVDIFRAYHKRNHKSKLIMVGVGEEMENVKRKVSEYSLDDEVIFTGLRSDVNRVLQAFDILVFPSKLEGLPLSLVEAQASGLPCLLSDHVSEETAITDLVQFERLDNSPEHWSETIEKMLNGFVRIDATEKIKNAGYDIEENAKRLKKIYVRHA